MKLQLENNEYYLMKDGEELAIATTDESFIKELDAERLSVKNCQAIFNGYDLDELAENHALEVYDKVEAYEDYQDYVNFNNRRNNFKEGFQKALSILGDKKFSEEDMKKAMNKIVTSTYSNKGDDVFDLFIEIHREKYMDEYIQSLQQTEWEVEIEVEEVYDGLDEMAQKQYRRQPKLDANGCIILKRK